MADLEMSGNVAVAPKTTAEIRTDRHRKPPPAGLLTVAALWPRTKENLGTLVRTCDALNATLVTTHAGSRMLDRGDTIGWRKNAHVEIATDWQSWLAWTGDRTVIAVELAHGSIPLCDLPPATTPTVVLLGHESTGIPLAAFTFVDFTVEIPMYGVGNSLNVAVAGSIVAYRLAGAA